MRIAHLALYVRDLEAAREFFCRYFDAQAGPLYHNQSSGFRSYFLCFDNGAQLELMTRPQLAAAAAAPACGYAHLAFSLGSPAQVDALTQRLQDDGYSVLSGPRTTGDGYYESCVSGIEGCQIELSV